MEVRKLVSRLCYGSLSSWAQSSSSPSVSLTGRQVRCISEFPRLESATARARKRRRRIAKMEASAAAAAAAKQTRAIPGGRREKPAEEEEEEDDPDIAAQYPKGQPWRVLWPNPHGEAPIVEKSKPVRMIPRLKDFRIGWQKYMETWEDGLSGVPSPEKLRELEAQEAIKEMARENAQDEDLGINKLQSNLSRNLQVARDSARDLLGQAKEKTNIHSRDDLKRVAADMLKLATECLKEFMVGYREGRDQEVDKMLHEYFKNDSPYAKAGDATSTGKKRKKRKPRRAILR